MSYTTDEIRGLIDHWLTLRHTDRLWIRVRYADLSRAVGALPRGMAQVVYVHGLLQLPVREASEVLGMSKSTVSRHYIDATEWMADYLSGV